MKKLSLIIAIFLIASLLSGCGTQNKVDETTTETISQTTEEQVVKISIKKETLAEPESFVNNMKNYGAKVQENDNADSYIFVFSQEEHKKVLEDKYEETVEKFKKYEENAEHYIDTIEYDEDFRNLTFNVNKELYDSSANATSNMVVAATALSYQLYLEGGQRTTVKVVYSGTEEVVSTFSLPMNFSIE